MENQFGTATGQSGFCRKISNISDEKVNNAVQDTSTALVRKDQRAITCTGFQEGDIQKALQQKKAQSNCFYKGEQVKTPVDLSHFRMYGSGIYLFFSFLYHISILFLILSLISIVPIVINYLKGSAFENSQQSLQYFVTKTTIGNYNYMSQKLSYEQSINYKIANVVIDIVTCVIFLVFCFFWQHRSEKIVTQINTSIKLLSTNTLEITRFPQKARQLSIKQFINKFGVVTQVAAVKNYSDLISISKDIYELKLKLKQLQLQNKIEQKQSRTNQINKLKEQQIKLEQISNKQQITKQEIIKFYVQLQTNDQRNQILQKFKPFQKVIQCCRDPPPTQMLLDGELIEVRACQTEPTGIIWENVHVCWKTRWIRMILQFVIILAVIAGGFILISFMNVLVPPNRPTVDTAAYDWTAIQKESNQTIVQAWCIKQLSLSAQSYQKVCFDYWKQYIISILIKVGIAVTIIVLKAVIKIVMVFIAKFQKYTTHTEQSVAIMTNLLITYISTTVLITFLMQANVFKISFKSIIKNFIQDQSLLNNLAQLTQYYDLTSNWYRDIGYQIWFNVLVLSLVPHIFMPVVLHVMECIGEYRAKGEIMYRKMYEKIRPAEFQIQDSYANILMIILIGFVFGGGSPCMILVSCLGLMTRYKYFKYIFIRFCRVPKTYNEALNKRAISILKVVLFIRCLISLYMYGADNIFAMEKSAFMKWTETLDLPLFSSIFIVISRIFLTWYYTMFVVLFAVIFFFKQLIVNTLIALCKKQGSNKNMQESGTDLNKDEIMSHRILTKSYKLENNPDYLEILAIMKMKLRNSVARQSISPTPMTS